MKIVRTILATGCMSAVFFSFIHEIIAGEPQSLAKGQEFAFGEVGVAGIESMHWPRLKRR